MTSFDPIFTAIDPYLIWPFRMGLALTGDSFAAFFIGAAGLGLMATIIGELSYFVFYWLNRKHYAELHQEMVQHNNLSIDAIRCGDKESYKACNHVANEAFGKNFFSQLALFAASIWPAAFALGWLSTRFAEVDFALPFAIPGFGQSVGYPFVFVPLYVLTRILFAKARPYLPVFSRMKKLMKENQGREEMRTWGELFEEKKPASNSAKPETSENRA